MPELPEVEVLRLKLEEQLLNLEIIDVNVIYNNMLKSPDFKNSIINKKILGFKRFGKYLIIKLNELNILVHLRMEGKFFLRDNNVINKHEHIVFTLSNNKYLVYHDVRKFGVMYLKLDEDLYNSLPLSKLGLEPFDINDSNIDIILKKINKNIAIKTLLLDQEIIVGLGNIYADEVLFLSKIHPNTLGTLITKHDLVNIVDNSINIFRNSIKEFGTTIRTYNSLGGSGNYQNYLYVHTRYNKKCLKCDSTIQKMKINGRTSYFCPSCQEVR